MKKFKFHRISISKRLRYIDNYYKKKIFIVFLHGFMSDIYGKKPQKLYKFAKKMRLGFLGLEYSAMENRQEILKISAYGLEC